MKKALSLILALVMCLSLFGCGGASKSSVIVGTWQGYTWSTEYIYIFAEDGTYKHSSGGYTNIISAGTYTYNEKKGSLILTDENGETCIDVEMRECFMILTDPSLGNASMSYGRVYAADEDCGVLNDVLGTWTSKLVSDSTLTFNKNGTYTLNPGLGSESFQGIYTYDPVGRMINILDAGLEFKLTQDDSGKTITCLNEGKSSLTFTKNEN